MAKITDGSFRDWQDTEVINAAEYKRERELLKVAVNDNDARLISLEQATEIIQLGESQLSKITTDDGGVKVSVSSADGNILTEIIKAGKGLHTFYAVGNSQSLPPSKLSIRGQAHITSVNPAFGWVKAIDWKGVEYSNYINNDVWTGWKEITGVYDQGKATNLNDMKQRGSFYVDPGVANSPHTSIWGILNVDSFNVDSYGSVTQKFIDGTTGELYTRSWTGFIWTKWHRMADMYAPQTELWSASNGWYLHAGQTVLPDKKLSECRNGWILLWSDFNPPSTTNNWNWTSTMIPKFMGTKHNGQNWSESFSAGTITGQADTVATKEFTVFNDKIVGDDNNGQGLSADLVLRYVIEW